MKLFGDADGAAVHKDDALQRLFALGLLGLLLQLALDLAHQRRLADAPDAHDREVAVGRLQDAAHLELAAEEARPGDGLARLVGRQERQVELWREAVQQFAGGPARVAHGLRVGLVQHQQRLVHRVQLLLEFLCRSLHDEDRVALGQGVCAYDLGQALRELAGIQRGQVGFLDDDDRRAVGEAQLPVGKIDEVQVVAEHFLVQLDLVSQRPIQQLEEVRHRLTPRGLDCGHNALPHPPSCIEFLYSAGSRHRARPDQVELEHDPEQAGQRSRRNPGLLGQRDDAALAHRDTVLGQQVVDARGQAGRLLDANRRAVPPAPARIPHAGQPPRLTLGAGAAPRQVPDAVPPSDRNRHRAVVEPPVGLVDAPVAALQDEPAVHVDRRLLRAIMSQWMTDSTSPPSPAL